MSHTAGLSIRRALSDSRPQPSLPSVPCLALLAVLADLNLAPNRACRSWSPQLDVKSVCLSLLSMLSSAKKKKRPPDNDSTVVMSQGQKTRNMQWEFHDDKC